MLKFGPEGGAIRLLAEIGPDDVQFSVQDCSPGIDGSDVPYIFDHYWQAAGQKGHGVGLGLTIALGIVHAHTAAESGWESELGRGSTFRFTLPRVASA